MVIMKTKYISINWFVKGPGISLHNTENQILNKFVHYFFWLQLTYISLISINLPGVFWKTTPSLNCYSTSTVPTFSPFYSFHHAGSEKVHVLLALNIKWHVKACKWSRILLFPCHEAEITNKWCLWFTWFLYHLQWLWHMTNHVSLPHWGLIKFEIQESENANIPFHLPVRQADPSWAWWFFYCSPSLQQGSSLAWQVCSQSW